MGKALTLRTLHGIARLAEGPELGTMIMVCGCSIVAISIQTGSHRSMVGGRSG
jgi:hypothetical protein